MVCVSERQRGINNNNDRTKLEEEKMKRLFAILLGFILLLGVSGTGTAEDIRSPFNEFTFEINLTGTTTAISGASNVASGISWFMYDRQANRPPTTDAGNSTFQISDLKMNLGVFSIQVYQVDLALSNPDNRTLDGRDSGATYNIVYQASNVDLAHIWETSAVTAVYPSDGVPLNSGTTVQVFPITPEFAKYYRFGFLTGITQFRRAKAKLILQ